MKTLNIFKNAWVALFFLVFSTTTSSFAGDQMPEALEATELRFSEFKCNVKDFHRNILFTAQGEYFKYFFFQNGLSILPTETLNANSMAVLKTTDHKQSFNLRWDNANSNMEVVGAEEFKYRRKAKAAKDCEEKQYRKLYFNQLYPGIDLMYADHADQLELDFQVAAGFNHGDISFRLDGAGEIKIDQSGRLIVNTPGGEFMLEKPLAQQEGKPLNASWIINGQSIQLKISACDHQKPTLIRTHLIQKGQDS